MLKRLGLAVALSAALTSISLQTPAHALDRTGAIVLGLVGGAAAAIVASSRGGYAQPVGYYGGYGHSGCIRQGDWTHCPRGVRPPGYGYGHYAPPPAVYHRPRPVYHGYRPVWRPAYRPYYQGWSYPHHCFPAHACRRY